jgi:hypothetical protein
MNLLHTLCKNPRLHWSTSLLNSYYMTLILQWRTSPHCMLCKKRSQL